MPDWHKHLDSVLAQEQIEAARLVEVRDEIAEHLDDRYHTLLAEGLRPSDAEQKVLGELQQGELGVELRRVLRPIPPSDDAPWSRHICRSVMSDVRYGLRQLRLSPGFTLSALLSLALGIGANTAIFQLLDAIRMRTLPVKDPQQLASVKIVYHPHGRVGTSRGVPDLSTVLYETIRARQQAFSTFAAWSVSPVDLSRTGEVHYGRVMLASGDLFDLLGVGNVMGRLLGPADDQRGCDAPPAVVSYGYWQREMGGRSSALGERVWVNRHAFVVTGITAPSFFGLEVGRRFDVALPLCAEPLITGESSVYNSAKGWWIGGIGRLKPGWDVQKASAHLAAISPSIMQATMPPEYNSAQRSGYAELKLGALPAATGHSRLRETYDRPFWLLLGISALVLLIACANLANLMLARGASREREMAVRLALGASRMRLLRQLLAESLLLAVLGALSGLLLAQVFSRALVPFLGSKYSQIFVDLRMDWRVLGFTTALALITCILFGLSPSLQGSGVAPSEAMKAGGRGVVASRSKFGFRRAIVVMQIALSLTLVLGAVLFVRTFRNLLTSDLGFEAERIIVADAEFSNLKIPPTQRIQYKQHLTSVIAAIPGVQSVARNRFEPVNGGAWNDEINIPISGTNKEVAWFNQVSPGYFATLRNPLIAGREFTDQDGLGAPQVAIISRAFATKLFHETTPIGKTFGVVQYGDKADVIYQVVGVVEDLKYVDLRKEFEPIAYLPDTQAADPDSDAIMMVRSDQPADILIPEIRSQLLKVNPELVLQFTLLKDDLADGLVAERLMAMLAGFFGVLAIVLAVVGLYGVITYMVTRRTNEIGIRLAVGANHSDILLLIMREVAAICGIGQLVGLGLSLSATPAIRSFLFGVRPTDPATLVLAVGGVSLVAVVASLLPALRAAQLDPMVALHDE